MFLLGTHAAPAVDLRELVWVGAFDDHRIGRRRGIARCSRRRWPIIHDEGDPAPSAADALQVDALTISEHHLKRPTGCSGERTSSGCPVTARRSIRSLRYPAPWRSR